MGGYEDFGMVPPEEENATAGVCHARGTNAGLPPYWMIYIVVADLGESLRRCEELGGKVVAQPKGMGSNRYSVIEAGMDFVVHPNQYLPESGYLMLGDTVWVEKDGYQRLTQTPMKLFTISG